MKFHPANERIKHLYFRYLRDAKRLDEQSIDTTAKAIHRFEEFTDWRDFAQFRTDHATAFKSRLVQQTSAKGQPLSKATIVSTLNTLKRFFSWLPGQTGYKSRLQYEWADYFNPSLKDVTIARTPRQPPVPTLDQVSRAISMMPRATPIQRRDQAVVALIALTGARDDAAASLRLKHVDLAEGMIDQDGRDVRTKFAKTIRTWFFPVGEEYVRIVTEWVAYLRVDLHFGPGDPLFPRTLSEFTEVGPRTFLGREGWETAGPIRKIFKQTFEGAGLPYCKPHSMRHMLARYGMEVCRTPEEFKAWSQNLGHDDVLTTFTSYGEIPVHRQRDLIKRVASSSRDDVRALELGRAALAAARKAE